MERQEIKENIKILSKEKERLFYVLSKSSNVSSILVSKDANVDIVIDNLEDSSNLEIVLQNNSFLNLSIISKNDINSLNLTVKIAQNASFQCYFADFSSNKNNSNVTIDLDGEKASCSWHLASLSLNKDSKTFSINVNHNKPETFATVDNYGVARDDGRLVFAGTSFILNGSSRSQTSQNAKIMVFDKLSNAVAKPILRIDENDIEANHSACVGKINDEHLFYLTSRGLSIDEAKQLIILGYLKPIISGFCDEKYKHEITNLIEGRL